LNTAAHHETKADAEQGRVSDETLDVLRTKVQGALRPQRILLVHHHPYRHDALDRTDYSALDGGPELLRILQDNGDWIVIHGHRHYPNLVYAAGSTTAPVILASGSFSAFLYPELRTRVRNQFHVLDLESAGTEPGTAGLVGTIQSWEYNYSTGWGRPTSSEGIPDQAGFGYRGSLEDALEHLCNVVRDSGERYITLEEVVRIHPSLKFLLPVDRQKLLKIAQDRGLVAVSPESNYSMHNSEIFLGRQNDVG
jgi:hypothetical protein